LPKDDKEPHKESKVTDRRIFTPEGDIKDEFRNDIKPVTSAEAKPEEKPAPAPEPAPQEDRKTERERRRSMQDRASNPGTPFTNFIEPLIAQAYMSLGMLRNPYQPQAKVDAGAARQMIDIVQLLQEKTKGNLTDDEQDFLETHLSELKLAYVQRTKSI